MEFCKPWPQLLELLQGRSKYIGVSLQARPGQEYKICKADFEGGVFLS